MFTLFSDIDIGEDFNIIIVDKSHNKRWNILDIIQYIYLKVKIIIQKRNTKKRYITIDKIKMRPNVYKKIELSYNTVLCTSRNQEDYYIIYF